MLNFSFLSKKIRKSQSQIEMRINFSLSHFATHIFCYRLIEISCAVSLQCFSLCKKSLLVYVYACADYHFMSLGHTIHSFIYFICVRVCVCANTYLPQVSSVQDSRASTQCNPLINQNQRGSKKCIVACITHSLSRVFILR